MVKCGQDCATVCFNCKWYGEDGITLCVKDGDVIPTDPYNSCDDFHCIRKKDNGRGGIENEL